SGVTRWSAFPPNHWCHLTSPRRTGRALLPTRPSSSVDAGVFARTPKPRTHAALLRGTRSFADHWSHLTYPAATGRASLPTRPSSSVAAGVFARTGAEQPCGFEHRKRSGKARSGRDRRASSPGRDETNAQRDERCPSSAQDYESHRTRTSEP